MKTRGSATGVTPTYPGKPRDAFITPNRPTGKFADSAAYLERNWTPTAHDTCSAELHAKYSVVASDGKRYPTWHPPVVWDRARHRMCSFGHEHGDNPTTSNIYGWVSSFLSKKANHAPGIPFGMVSEASTEHNHGHDMRHEDNVGHKVVVANSVPLLQKETRAPITVRRGHRQVKVTCDYLIKMHQGSHSSDATKNNAHELIYAVSCTDSTKAIISTLSRLGKANEYHRSCDPEPW